MEIRIDELNEIIVMEQLNENLNLTSRISRLTTLLQDIESLKKELIKASDLKDKVINNDIADYKSRNKHIINEINYNDVNFNGRTLTNVTLPTSIIGVKAMCRLNFLATTPFYTMVNHFGFLLIPPANTTYVSYRGTGRITIYVNIATGVSANFQVIAQGSYNGDTTTAAGPTTMLISNPVKGTLSSGGSVVARSLDLTFTRTNAAATLTNLVAGGFIDVTIIG